MLLYLVEFFGAFFYFHYLISLDLIFFFIWSSYTYIHVSWNWITFSFANSSLWHSFSAFRIAACFSAGKDASPSYSAIFSLSSKALCSSDAFPDEPSDDFDFDEWDDFLELLSDDLFELLDDLFDLLSFSASHIQLYTLCFWVNTTFIYCFKPIFFTFM